MVPTATVAAMQSITSDSPCSVHERWQVEGKQYILTILHYCLTEALHVDTLADVLSECEWAIARAQ